MSPRQLLQCIFLLLCCCLTFSATLDRAALQCDTTKLENILVHCMRAHLDGLTYDSAALYNQHECCAFTAYTDCLRRQQSTTCHSELANKTTEMEDGLKRKGCDAVACSAGTLPTAATATLASIVIAVFVIIT